MKRSKLHSVTRNLINTETAAFEKILQSSVLNDKMDKMQKLI